MIKRLEQIAALVVAAGLALVSYWLFFSWAQGGGSHKRQLPVRSALPPPQGRLVVEPARNSKPSPRLEQPALGFTVIEAGDMVAHILGTDGESLGGADGHDPTEGSTGILQGLAKQRLSQLRITADAAIELGCVA